MSDKEKFITLFSELGIVTEAGENETPVNATFLIARLPAFDKAVPGFNYGLTMQLQFDPTGKFLGAFARK